MTQAAVRLDYLEGKIAQITLDQPGSRANTLGQAVIAELGATGKKDMGAVMKALQERVAGRADNRVLSAEVAKRLP